MVPIARRAGGTLVIAGLLGAAALLAGAGAGSAETWAVKTGSGEYPVAEFTLQRNASDGLSGTATLQDAAGATASGMVGGTVKNLMVEIPSGTCLFRATEFSATAASGTGQCPGAPRFAWTATIAGLSAADTAPPTLLAAGEDPRKSPAYAALSPGERQAAEAEAESFRAERAVSGTYAALHDLQCLAGQYLNIRVQKPAWTETEIFDAIQVTCVAPDQVRAWATARCEAIYTGPDTPAAAVAEATGQPLVIDPDLCKCYGDKFTEAYLKSPSNNDLATTSTGTAVYAACTAPK